MAASTLTPTRAVFPLSNSIRAEDIGCKIEVHAVVGPAAESGYAHHLELLAQHVAHQVERVDTAHQHGASRCLGFGFPSRCKLVPVVGLRMVDFADFTLIYSLFKFGHRREVANDMACHGRQLVDRGGCGQGFHLRGVKRQRFLGYRVLARLERGQGMLVVESS